MMLHGERREKGADGVERTVGNARFPDDHPSPWAGKTLEERSLAFQAMAGGRMEFGTGKPPKDAKK